MNVQNINFAKSKTLFVVHQTLFAIGCLGAGGCVTKISLAFPLSISQMLHNSRKICKRISALQCQGGFQYQSARTFKLMSKTHWPLLVTLLFKKWNVNVSSWLFTIWMGHQMQVSEVTIWSFLKFDVVGRLARSSKDFNQSMDMNLITFWANFFFSFKVFSWIRRLFFLVWLCKKMTTKGKINSSKNPP